VVNLEHKLEYQVQIGFELEFCITTTLMDSEVLHKISELCCHADLSIFAITKEEGDGQFEVALQHRKYTDALSDLARLREVLQANFHLKYSNNCGLHVHISLHNAGESLFVNDYILHRAIAGLCHFMAASMYIFCPNNVSYKRLNAEQHCPSNVSWGGDNRTTSLRIPPYNKALETRHIEHRLPWAGSDATKVTNIIIYAIDYGLSHNLILPPKIYGNAFDKQYNCPPLPVNLDEAKKLYYAYKLMA